MRFGFIKGRWRVPKQVRQAHCICHAGVVAHVSWAATLSRGYRCAGPSAPHSTDAKTGGSTQSRNGIANADLSRIRSAALSSERRHLTSPDSRKVERHAPSPYRHKPATSDSQEHSSTAWMRSNVVDFGFTSPASIFWTIRGWRSTASASRSWVNPAFFRADWMFDPRRVSSV